MRITILYKLDHYKVVCLNGQAKLKYDHSGYKESQKGTLILATILPA